MKSSIRTVIVLLCLVLGAAAAYGQQGRGPAPGEQSRDGGELNGFAPGGPASEAKREEVRKKVEAIRMWRLTEALKLDEKTSTQLASFLSSLEEKRRGIMKSNLASMRDLRAALRAGKPDERQLKTGLDRVEQNQRDMIDLRQKEINGIKGMLSIEQQARYVVFQQEFRREMRGMIAGARGKGPGPGMRGGPGMGPGPGDQP